MWKNSQPIYRDVVDTQFALAHNGNLVNTAELAEDAGMLAGTVSSDTEAMAEQIALACERLGPGRATCWSRRCSRCCRASTERSR